MILKLPSHLTEVSSQEIRRRCRFPDPWTLLEQDAQHRREMQAWFPAKTLQSWQEHVAVSFQQEVLQTDIEVIPLSGGCSLRPVNPAHLVRPITCQHCGLDFPTLLAVRTHIARMRPEHTEGQDRSAILNLTREALAQHMMQGADDFTAFVWVHSSEGLPKCRHCRHDYSSWDELQHHIMSRSCPSLFPDGHTPSRPTARIDESAVSLLWNVDGQSASSPNACACQAPHTSRSL